MPDLKILNDSRENGNRNRSPNWEKEEKMEELEKQLDGLSPGDIVTAFGKSTTGAEVSRTGALLAEPQNMTATHDGVKGPAIRVRIGEPGTDPAARKTWTTLIPGHGSIRKEVPEEGEGRPVYHAVTGALVGHLTRDTFTPVEP
ncbi:hypothetical protein [Streptomyces sp. NPDC005955]|uniref:hypothetical protein n=1 Tax=Streptomyces sp. NPDC005955 TaxID=3364738 RepID=UPI0036B51DC4